MLGEWAAIFKQFKEVRKVYFISFYIYLAIVTGSAFISLFNCFRIDSFNDYLVDQNELGKSSS